MCPISYVLSVSLLLLFYPDLHGYHGRLPWLMALKTEEASRTRDELMLVNYLSRVHSPHTYTQHTYTSTTYPYTVYL